MQTKISSIGRIPKVRRTFNKLAALMFLPFGIACMAIMLSPSPIFAQGAQYESASGAKYNSDGKLMIVSGDGDKGGDYYIGFYTATAIGLGLGFVGWILTHNVLRAAEATDRRMEEIYQSLPPELRREYNEQYRENFGPKECLNLLIKIKKITEQ
jgi:hypothetical protein